MVSFLFNIVDDMQKSLSIPKDPGFDRIIELFTDADIRYF